MVRVVSAHHFLSQSIQTCDVPYAATTAPPDRLLVALSHQVEVRDLLADGEVKFTFPTVDQSHFLAYCAAGIISRYYAKPVPEVKEVKVRKKRLTKQSVHANELFDYFSQFKFFIDEKDNIPTKYMDKKQKRPENLYLLNESVAKDIVCQIRNDVLRNGAPVFESSPGLGLLTKELLAAGVCHVRAFETDPTFKLCIEKIISEHPGKVVVSEINFLHIWKLFYQDLMVSGDRMNSLMEDIETKQWHDEAFVNFIGVLTNSTFIRHILYSVIFQNGIVAYGRPELYVLLTPTVYMKIHEDNKPAHQPNQQFPVLFSLFFDYHLYGTVDRLSFIPWQNVTKKLKNACDSWNLESDKLYLVRLSPKRDLFHSVPQHMIKPLWFFIKHNLKNKKSRVIPKLEQWVPGCGPRLINLGFDVFTQFSELSSQDILKLFKEFYSWPEFPCCAFIPAMELTTMKMETPSDLDMDMDDLKPEEDQASVTSE